MDANWFDTLTKSVARPGTRRDLARLVATLPLASVVANLLGEDAAGQGNGAGVGGGGGRRRRRRTHHQPGQDKNHRSGKRKRACAKAGQTLKQRTRKRCCQGLSPDASGRCAAPDPGPGPDPDSCTGLKPTTGSSPTQGLQEAIDGAEPGSTLTLCARTWNLTSTVEITRDLTLIGAGAGKTILDGGNAVGVLLINPRIGNQVTDATVTLRDLTITKGKASGFGGGIINDNPASLTLIRVSVTSSTATDPGHGGGIFNRGTLTLEDGTVIGGTAGEGNTAAGSGGGIYNTGGMVILRPGSLVTDNTASSSGGGVASSSGTVTLEDGSSVTGNSAGFWGGGIYSEFGSVTLQTGSSVVGNSNRGEGGGGIVVNGSTLTLQSGSSVTSNTARSDGGGILNYNGGVTLKAGSSVSGNTAGGRGGGIHNHDATLTLEAGSSVTNNSADESGGGVFHSGFLTLKEDSSVTGNTAPEGAGIYSEGDMTWVTMEGPDPSPIVVNNCQDNCAGPTPMPKCAVTPVSCS